MDIKEKLLGISRCVLLLPPSNLNRLITNIFD